MRGSRVAGLGHHVPERVVTNHDLCELMDTSDEWIVQRTGIRERRWVVGDVGASIPIALHEAVEAGLVAEGDLVVLAAFGAGLTWGANLLVW